MISGYFVFRAGAPNPLSIARHFWIEGAHFSLGRDDGTVRHGTASIDCKRFSLDCCLTMVRMIVTQPVVTPVHSREDSAAEESHECLRKLQEGSDLSASDWEEIGREKVRCGRELVVRP